MLEAGAIMVLLVRTMPGRRRSSKLIARNEHIKFEAMAPYTIRRCKTVVRSSVAWRKLGVGGPTVLNNPTIWVASI